MVITKEIIKHKSSKTTFFCLEINEKFVFETQKNCPNTTVYHASAIEITKYLKKHDQSKCDCVISGLPWALFEQKKQEEIIDEIYKSKNEEDIFILSSGHAALALYVILEKYEGKDAEELFLKHGGHPHRDEENGIYCSTGSLGLGITVAVGRALADKNRKVHVLISDGESAEGSVWEALRFIKESS